MSRFGRWVSLAGLLLLAGLLTGCGGGGPAAAPEPDWRTRYQQLEDSISSANERLAGELAQARQGEATWKVWTVLGVLVAAIAGSAIGSRARLDAERGKAP